MKPTPLLDFWQKPAGAGEPVAMLATTFAFDPDFFEQNCLARFLEVSSVNEDTGSIDDIVASVELHQLLRNTRVTVLADRSAPVQRTSLLWDLLSCKVDGGGLLHAKVTVLLWTNATRVILGSANLTAAGYRRQIELGLAADLGPGCLFPPAVLTAIADELESYLELVPGHDTGAPVFTRARSTLALFRQRIAGQPIERSAVSVAFAPTNAQTSPLAKLDDVWNGPQPLTATHLSPFWDSNDRAVLNATGMLLTGRPKTERSHRVAVVLSPTGQTSFSRHLRDAVDTVNLLKIDDEVRTLHAKCLLIASKEWVAALVGSSNHTKAGLGLVTSGRHREMNVWLGASRDSNEGKALLSLIELGKNAPKDAEEVESKDEDEVVLPALPTCFGLCRVTRPSDSSPWELHLGITATKDMPAAWDIGLAAGAPSVMTRVQWEASGKPETVMITLMPETMPMYALVRCEGNDIPWAVVADDRHGLPPGAALSGLRAQQLLTALASGRSLAQTLREELERKQADVDGKSAINLDPLKRLEVEGSLLRKGRALGASLSAMQSRLEPPVITADALRARLASPLGPEFVATKVAEAYEAGEQTRAEAVFTIAEIALAIGRVKWANVLVHLEQVERAEGLSLVNQSLDRLDALRARIGTEPADLASYAHRAIKKTRECLAC